MSHSSSYPVRIAAGLLSGLLFAAPAFAQNNAGNPAITPVVNYSKPPVVGFNKYEWTFKVDQLGTGAQQKWFWAQQVSFVGGQRLIMGLIPNAEFGRTAVVNFSGNGTSSVFHYCKTDANGSGTPCRSPYAWVEGRTYKFSLVLRGEYPSRSHAVWAASITDTVTSIKSVVGIVAVYKDWGLIAPGNLSWAYWIGDGSYGCAQRTAFRATFGAPVGYINDAPFAESIASTTGGSCATFSRPSPTEVTMAAGGTP